MRHSKWKWLLVFELIVLAPLGRAQEAAEPREIDQHYNKQKRSDAGIFQTLPITHITPDKNHFIFAMKYDAINAKINGEPSSVEHLKSGYNPDETLKLTGSNASPFLGYSYDKIGMGVTGEWGELHSRYRNSDLDLAETGDMKFHGFGAHLFLNPIPTMKQNNFNMIAGGKVLQVEHAASSHADTDETSRTINYKVFKSEIGGNINIRVFNSFAIIPWASYSKVFTNDFDRAYNASSSDGLSAGESENAERLAGDADIFWNDQARLNLGIDIAIKVSNLEFHIGNVMDALLNANRKSSARLRDHSISVGVLLRSGD